MRDPSGYVPPHDLDAEAAVLSAIMIRGREAVDDVGGLLAREHFFSEGHGRVFEACIAVHVAGAEPNVVLVGSELKSSERIGQVGGMAYLTELLTAAPAVSSEALRSFAAIVRKLARLRAVIREAQKIGAEGYFATDADAFVNDAEARIHAVADETRASTFVHAKHAISGYASQIAEAAKRGTAITGSPSGFAALDQKTGGFHDGDLAIIAARPGMGKTSLALNIAVSGAKRGAGAAIFSIEMPREQIAARMQSSEAGIDLGAMRAGVMSGTSWQRFTEAAIVNARLPIWIDDSPSPTVHEIASTVRRIRREAQRAGVEIRLVVIDYLQLMRGASSSRRNGENREQEISGISRALKALAKSERLPVIALSQLNRSVETRSEKNKRPQLSDLRESGAIEQDADVVLFVYRASYYAKQRGEAPAREGAGVAEVIIAKQRNGPTGIVRVRFDESTATFRELEDDGDDDTRLLPRQPRASCPTANGYDGKALAAHDDGDAS